MRLEEAKTKYQGEWVAFRSFDESDNPEGEVILHNKDRRIFDKELVERGLNEDSVSNETVVHTESHGALCWRSVAVPLSIGKLNNDVYITFAGPPVPEGYAVMFGVTKRHEIAHRYPDCSEDHQNYWPERLDQGQDYKEGYLEISGWMMISTASHNTV